MLKTLLILSLNITSFEPVIVSFLDQEILIAANIRHVFKPTKSKSSKYKRGTITFPKRHTPKVVNKKSIFNDKNPSNKTSFTNYKTGKNYYGKK